MPILIKLVQAVLLGIIMVFSLMLMVVAGAAFVGFISHMLGLTTISEKSFEVQRRTWLKTKVWFFRYKDINKEDDER